MPRQPFRVATFLSSYAPLFGLLAYTNRRVCGAWEILTGIAVASVIALAGIIFSKRDDRGPRLVVAHARPKDGEVLAYIATYLIPFFGIDLSQTDDVVTLCVFLVVLLLVYVNSSMLFVNPLLSIAGYHSFEIEDEDGHAYTLLARRTDIVPGTTLHPAQISRYIRLEVKP
jgi:hypothetical protein